MQDLILLILGALFVYLLFSRKGGMGMGCCGGHGSYGDNSDHGRQDNYGGHCGHGTETDRARHLDELSEVRKEEIIDLREDQYTVVTVEENEDKKLKQKVS